MYIHSEIMCVCLYVGGVVRLSLGILGLVKMNRLFTMWDVYNFWKFCERKRISKWAFSFWKLLWEKMFREAFIFNGCLCVERIVLLVVICHKNINCKLWVREQFLWSIYQNIQWFSIRSFGSLNQGIRADFSDKLKAARRIGRLVENWCWAIANSYIILSSYYEWIRL